MSKEAVFAARICSIDRFTGALPSDFVRKYELLFKKYFDVTRLTGILEGRSGYEEEHQRLVRAREVARAETDTADGRTTAGKNLASVFSRLSLTDEQKQRSEFYRYHFSELSPDKAFPVKENLNENKEQLVSAFYKDMDRLDANRPETYEAFSVCFERITLKYMWCFTASDFEGEDISLYDYLKVTEAVMACLEECQEEKCPYTMVIGDFSGIQKYIFSISSANFSGVTKRLRARSFYVDLVSRVFSQYIADQFHMGRENILLQTGGKFYCILPTEKDMDIHLEKIRNEFDSYLYRTFHGSVSVNMAWLACDDDGLRDYSSTIVRLNELLGEKKASPFQSVIKDENGWRQDCFILQDDLKEKHMCKSCGMELIDIEENSCEMCGIHQEIGSLLPKSRYILFMRRSTNKKNTYKVFDNYYIRLCRDFSAEDFGDAYLIEALNNSPINKDIFSYPVIRKYMANHVPLLHDTVKTFSEIAQASEGMKKLAVLKADVDVLGFLFAQGLRTEQRHYGTISRVNTMSRMLELFFSGYIEYLLENNSLYQNVYSVFSGGDDLFLIGPWNVMMELSVDIQKKFKRFVAENESVSLSAAVSVFDDKEHIAFMAEQSEEQLDRAKNEILAEVYPDRKGRNAVCVTGQIFSWPDFENQLSISNKLKKMLNGQQLNVSMLRRLAKYSDMYREFLIDKNVWKLMFEPLFHYDRKRNYSMKLTDEDAKWFQQEYIRSMENAADYRTVKKNLYFAETVVKIVLNKTREGGRSGER